MCGRYTFQATEEFYERFQIGNRLDALVPRYNIAPGQMVPVIIAQSPRRIVLMRWGLIPHGAKDAKTAYKMINARVETLTQRPAIRGLLSHNRALVPACSYYEWQGEGREKTPYFIRPEDQQYLAFAGLYDVWRRPDQPSPKLPGVSSFLILMAKSETGTIDVQHGPENQVYQRAHSFETDFAIGIKSGQEPGFIEHCLRTSAAARTHGEWR